MRIPSVEPRGTQAQDAAPSAGADARDRSLMARAERTAVVPETARPVESTGGAGAQVSISEQARRMAEKSLERALTMVEGPKARGPVAGEGQTALPGKSGVGALRSKLVHALFERVQGKDTTAPPQDPADAQLEESQTGDARGTEAARSGAREAEAQAPSEGDDAAARARAEQEAARAERAREEAAAEARRREAALRGEPEAAEDQARPVSVRGDDAEDAAQPLQVGFGDNAAPDEAQAPEIGFSAGREGTGAAGVNDTRAQDETPAARSTAPEPASRDTRTRSDESTPVEARETSAQAPADDGARAPVGDAAQAPVSDAPQSQESADQVATPSTEDASRAAPAVARRAAAYSADVAAQRSTAEAQIRLVV